MTLPKYVINFQTSLQTFDPLLSIRWGSYVEQWVIQRDSIVGDVEIKFLKNESGRLERKINSGVATEKMKVRYYGIVEELICAKLGKRVILFTSSFGPKIFDTLALGDIQRYGGYSRYADKTDQESVIEEKKLDTDQKNKRESIHSEVWGRRGVYDFLTSKRQTDIHQFGVRDMRKLLGVEWSRAGAGVTM